MVFRGYVLPAFQNLSTSCNKLVDFKKSVEIKVRCNVSFANFLQLIETTCSKPVDKTI